MQNDPVNFVDPSGLFGTGIGEGGWQPDYAPDFLDWLWRNGHFGAPLDRLYGLDQAYMSELIGGGGQGLNRVPPTLPPSSNVPLLPSPTTEIPDPPQLPSTCGVNPITGTPGIVLNEYAYVQNGPLPTGVAAAIANAVYHATGKRIRDLPITPDKLL